MIEESLFNPVPEEPPTVVKISEKEYQSLPSPEVSLVDFFQKSPLTKVNLDLSRD